MLNNNKQPGTDHIVTAELLKNGGDLIITSSVDICNAVFNGSKPSWQWTQTKSPLYSRKVIDPV